MGSWGEPVLVGEVVHPSHENIDLNLHSLQTRKFYESFIMNQTREIKWARL